jgi:hypothetical protein
MDRGRKYLQLVYALPSAPSSTATASQPTDLDIENTRLFHADICRAVAIDNFAEEKAIVMRCDIMPF